MKRMLVSVVFALLAAVGFFAMTVEVPSVAAPPQNGPPTDRLSYAIGLNIGHGMRQQGITIDANSFLAGVQTGLSGAKPAFSEQELQQVLGQFRQQMMAKQQAAAGQRGATAKAAGQAFLAKNGKRKGVTTTASGLQYRVLASGQGKKPTANDRVQVHYKGRLLDGTVFDSSYQRGQPASFQVDRVIPGWTEALQLMREGDKWELVIPSELAYGERGAGGRIGPNEVLVFEVELLKVDPASTP